MQMTPKSATKKRSEKSLRTFYKVAALSLAMTTSAASWGFGEFQFGISAANVCNPLAVSTCGLPFPSDVFRNPFGGYNFSDRILDRRTSGPVRVLAPARLQYPLNFRPSKVFNSSDGFSALGPVLFELNDWPGNPKQHIPADGEGVLHVYNVKTGERVPMRVSLSKAANPANKLREASPVIIGWPRSRFEFGEKYIALLYKDKLNASVNTTNDGKLFAPTKAVESALNGTAHWLNALAYREPLAAMKKLNIDKDELLSFTWFTVRSEKSVTEPLKKMVAQALAMPNYARDFRVVDPIGDNEYGLVTLEGQTSLVNFRSLDGGVYPPYRPIADSSRRVTDFTLSLPKWDKESPIPIAIRGHGLGQARSTITEGFQTGDRMGIATLAIDHPNHGSRATQGRVDILKEPYIGVAVSNPMTIMQLLGMFVQSAVDHNVLIDTAKHSLPLSLANWSHKDYPKLPVLDGNKVVFDGVSLSGMVGAAVGATAPKLTGAYLTNGTGSLMQIFSQSTFWEPFTSNVVPKNMNGAELTFIVAMMQHYVDIGDGNNFAHYYRNPIEGYEPRPLAMHYTIGDGSVTNGASLATAEIAQIPLLKKVIKPVPQLPFGTEGADGHQNFYGIMQSGFELKTANTTIDALKKLDIDKRLGLNNNSFLTNLLGFDPNKTPVKGSIPAMLGQLIGINNLGNQKDPNTGKLIDQLYQGETKSFAAHFNRNNEAARYNFIDWHCGLLNLDAERCSIAKVKASEDIKRFNDSVQNAAKNSPQRNLADELDKRVNIQVKEASSGSGSYGLLALLLAGLFLRSRRRS